VSATPQISEQYRVECQARWLRRKPWTRTETARWGNDRSEPLLALLRRRPGRWPDTSRNVGEWLKINATPVFDRIHARLGALPSDEAREALLPSDALR